MENASILTHTVAENNSFLDQLPQHVHSGIYNHKSGKSCFKYSVYIFKSVT